MGMSSSQARLLTLTARLHSIELKAQKHEADKLRLANDSDRVYETYLNALEQTKFVAGVLSNDGSMTYIDLTANAIYNYKTLQTQYSLITKENKTLISSSLSENYKNTNTLSDFLNAYGLISSETTTGKHEVPNPEYTQQEDNYNKDYQKWLDKCAKIDADYDKRYAEYLENLNNWDKNKDKEYQKWLEEEPVKTDQTQPWWTNSKDDSLAKKFEKAGAYCFNSAINGSPTCYAHVLIRMIDFEKAYNSNLSDERYAFADPYWYQHSPLNNYKTSTGDSFKLKHSIDSDSPGYIKGAGITLFEEDGGAENSAIFNELSQVVNNGLMPVLTPGETCDVTSSSTKYEKLKSKWNVDGSLKSIKQWAQDLYYLADNAYRLIVKRNPDTNALVGAGDLDKKVFPDLTNTVKIFQEALINSLPKEFDGDIYEEYHQKWLEKNPNNAEQPSKPEKPPYPPEPKRKDYITVSPIVEEEVPINHTTINDKDKAQWYINLWYKMEGQNKTAKVVENIVYDDATNTKKIFYSCDNISKSNTTYGTNEDWSVEENENYMVIPDDMLNDPKWIRNAVLQGYVLIQEFDRENNKFFDTSVSVTTGIHEVADEVGVKKAEAQYEADMKKIDRKDRYYDTEIAKCENERSAIIDELDTLKTVAEENVDRTFKLFS